MGIIVVDGAVTSKYRLWTDSEKEEYKILEEIVFMFTEGLKYDPIIFSLYVRMRYLDILRGFT